MDEISRNSAPEPWPPVPGKLIALLVAAVVLAHAIWACLSALTNGLLLPFLSGIARPDPQVTQILGKADPGFPAIISSVFELGLTAAAFLVVRRWTGPKPTPAPAKPAKPAKAVKVVKQVKVMKAVPRPASQSLSILAPSNAAQTSAEPEPSVGSEVAAPSSPPPRTAEQQFVPAPQVTKEEPLRPPRSVEQPVAIASQMASEAQIHPPKPLEEPAPVRSQPVNERVQVQPEFRAPEEPVRVTAEESTAVSAPLPSHSAPAPAPTSKSKKPKEKEKEVYYNLVGDPIGPVEDD